MVEPPYKFIAEGQKAGEVVPFFGAAASAVYRPDGEVRPDLVCEGRIPVRSLVTSRVTGFPGEVVMPPNLPKRPDGGLSSTQETQMAQA
jgi:hypothetical protein